MKRQVLVIHGGNVTSRYEEYLENLKAREITLEKLRRKDWKASLGVSLGEGHEVFLPRLPNADNAKFLEWRIYFEKLLPLMGPGILLVGHSLGAIFLAKYLSEETIPKPVQATFLVAAPFWMPDKQDHGDFVLPPKLDRFAQQGGEIFLYHSHDDETVPFADMESYRRALPNACFRIVDGMGHFNAPMFPELVHDILGFSRD